MKSLNGHRLRCVQCISHDVQFSMLVPQCRSNIFVAHALHHSCQVSSFSQHASPVIVPAAVQEQVTSLTVSTPDAAHPATILSNVKYDAPIIPGAAAADLQIGDDIRKLLAFATPDEADELGVFTIHRFGPVKVWSSFNAVSQIGVFDGYRGALNHRIRIGSTIAEVQDSFGREVKEDDEDNLVLIDYSGFCFETEEWHGNHSVQQNLSRRITEIYVYKGSSISATHGMIFGNPREGRPVQHFLNPT